MSRQSWWQQEDSRSSIEYAVLLAFVIVGVLVALSYFSDFFSSTATNTFHGVGGKLGR